MFFTRIARLLAWLGFIFGIMRLVIAFGVASIDDVKARTFAVARYLGDSSLSTGQHIDRTIAYLLMAIALGVLAEISRAIHNPDRLR